MSDHYLNHRRYLNDLVEETTLHSPKSFERSLYFSPSEDDDDDIYKITEKESDSEQHTQTTSSNGLHALGDTIRNTLLEISKIREQNQERRHRELLEIFGSIAQQNNLPKILTAEKKVTNLPTEILETNLHNSTSDNIVYGNSEHTGETSTTSRAFDNKSNLANANSTKKTSTELNSGNIKVVHNFKEEMQRMRVMLDIQKMEDRERKKLKRLQSKK